MQTATSNGISQAGSGSNPPRLRAGITYLISDMPKAGTPR